MFNLTPAEADPIVALGLGVLAIGYPIVGALLARHIHIWRNTEKLRKPGEEIPVEVKPLSQYAQRQARRAARAVRLVPRGSGDGRRATVRGIRAATSILDEVDR